MLPEDWLEIKLVSHIKIGRDRFRVTVDHDGFVATFRGSQNSVDTTVVKFNSLPDPVGTGA